MTEQSDNPTSEYKDLDREFSVAPLSSQQLTSNPALSSTIERKDSADSSSSRSGLPNYALLTLVSAFRAITVTFFAAILAATILMWWTSPEFLSSQVKRGLAPVQATAASLVATPTFLPTPYWFNRIGIVAGHSGIATYGRTKSNVDPGATCPDGFTEAAVTMKVAMLVVAILKGYGYTVDLLEEFDPQLPNYRAAAFISIHAQPCEEFGYGGFSIASSPARRLVRDQDVRLGDCIQQYYHASTTLEFQAGNITEDMTDYHAFTLPGLSISDMTPGVVLELGFIGHDRAILEHHPDLLAQGIVDGIQCFFNVNSRPMSSNSIPTLPP